MLHAPSSLFSSLFQNLGALDLDLVFYGGERKIDLGLGLLLFLRNMLFLCLFRCVCEVRWHGHVRMDVSDIEARIGLPLVQVKKFVAATKKHCEGLKTTITYRRVETAVSIVVHRMSLSLMSPVARVDTRTRKNSNIM